MPQVISFDERTAMNSLQQKLSASRIPTYMHSGLIGWIVFGQPPGDFLDAVLSNDLMRACERADDMNRTRLFDYASFLFNYAPRGCFGGWTIKNEWQIQGGLRGIYRREEELAAANTKTPEED